MLPLLWVWSSSSSAALLRRPHRRPLLQQVLRQDQEGPLQASRPMGHPVDCLGREAQQDHAHRPLLPPQALQEALQEGLQGHQGHRHPRPLRVRQGEAKAPRRTQARPSQAPRTQAGDPKARTTAGGPQAGPTRPAALQARPAAAEGRTGATPAEAQVDPT